MTPSSPQSSIDAARDRRAVRFFSETVHAHLFQTSQAGRHKFIINVESGRRKWANAFDLNTTANLFREVGKVKAAKNPNGCLVLT